MSVTIIRGTGRVFLHQLPEETPARGLVPPVLQQDARHVPVLVHGPPQVLPHPVDLDEHLVQVPLIAGPGPVAAQGGRVPGAEPVAPPADRLMGDGDPPGREQLLDFAEGEREAEIPPHAVRDDPGRVAVALVRRRRTPHGRSPSTMINPKIIPPGQPT
ncbi:hypothetical protein GCM10027162_46720 [Streptomyces incanus]